MNKQFISRLATDVEARYGRDISVQMFGDINEMQYDYASLSAWFNNFITSMDKLGDKEFLVELLSNQCPCRYVEAEEDIKRIYTESKTLEDFVARLDENGIFQDSVELRGNVLYATKLPWSESRKILGLSGHNHSGCYADSCHCFLASHASKQISDIFCHCCTVGYYQKMFKNALGVDVKIEFIDSVITGGKGCTAAIHLPPKN